MLRKLLPFGIILLLPNAYAASPPVLDRNSSIINAFQVMCNLTAPDFDRIAARATAMHMQVQSAEPPIASGGTKTEHKAWLGQLTTGPFGLLLDKMFGSKGTSTSCAVFGQVADADVFRTALVKEMKLNNLLNPEIANGAKSFIWPNISGLGTTLILRDLTPSGRPAVMVRLLSMVPNY